MYDEVRSNPPRFLQMTGMTVPMFDTLLDILAPKLALPYQWPEFQPRPLHPDRPKRKKRECHLILFTGIRMLRNPSRVYNGGVAAGASDSTAWRYREHVVWALLDDDTMRAQIRWPTVDERSRWGEVRYSPTDTR